MRKTNLLLFISLLALLRVNLSLCQIIEGRVVDDETKEKLSYVNVGIQGKNLGTVTDTTGYFKLLIKEPSYDTLMFSLIGYESYAMAIHDLMNTKSVNIRLRQKAYQLKEVVVSSKKYKYEVLGNQDKSKHRKLGIGQDQLGSELGTVIKVKNIPAYLESAKFYIVKNDYGKIRLRLNIYALKNDNPSESILNKPIYVETDLKSGLWSIDLAEFNLVVNDDFFISLEHIQDMGYQGLYFSFGFDNSASFVKAASQADWKKINYNGKSIGAGFSVIVSYEKR